MNAITHTYHQSPIGKLLLRRDGAALTGLWIAGQKHAPAAAPDWQWSEAGFDETRAELDAYFSGSLRNFATPPLRQRHPFQRAVWQELARIPFGQAISYGELARRVGSPGGMRAVGAANGRNPICIIIPCHRVIGADGALTGYSGGLPAKKWLLSHEGISTPALL